MSAGPRVLLLQLSERTSAKGNAYMSDWLGKASVVAFQAEEPDKWGNPTWDLFVSEPQPRAERQADGTGEVRSRPEPSSRSAGTAAPKAPAKPSASPGARGDGWRGSSYRRPASGAKRGATADGGAFVEDGVDDLYR
jgi:hypothetical protein